MTRESLTPEQHRTRHAELHKAFDELLACYLRAHPRKLPSQITALELIEWSHHMTQHAGPSEGAELAWSSGKK